MVVVASFVSIVFFLFPILVEFGNKSSWPQLDVCSASTLTRLVVIIIKWEFLIQRQLTMPSDKDCFLLLLLFFFSDHDFEQVYGSWQLPSLFCGNRCFYYTLPWRVIYLLVLSCCSDVLVIKKWALQKDRNRVNSKTREYWTMLSIETLFWVYRNQCD